MSARHVLGVLEDDGPSLWRTFDCAVALADRELARLTLAKTTDPGVLLRWFGGAAMQSVALSSDELDFPRIASHTLARVVEFVPAGIPVTTVVLGTNTTRALLAVIERGCFDTLVAGETLLTRRRLRCALGRIEIRTVVPAGPPQRTAHPYMIGASA